MMTKQQASKFSQYSEEAQRLLVIKELDTRIEKTYPWLLKPSSRQLRIAYLSMLMGKKISSATEFHDFELFYAQDDESIAKGLKAAYDLTVL